MKFIISRTSIGDEDKPCEEAEKITVPYWHTRTCNEEEYNQRFSQREGLWRSKGKDHKITKEGYVTRREDDRERWGLDINSLEKVMEIVKRYGSIVIEEYNCGDDDNPVYQIEIYDDYRE